MEKINEGKKDKFCSQCGRKRKKEEYFCPKCGYKFDDMVEELSGPKPGRKILHD